MKELKFGIYIIESLNNDDNKDGLILHEILNVCGIENYYNSIKTKEEFIKTINDFENCRFRYLHLSFHGNKNGFKLNDGTFITNAKFSEIIGDNFKNRRFFMSSCETGNLDLAGKLITKNMVFSLIGSPINIRFDKSSLFFPTFYHLMSEFDADKMKKKELKKSLQMCTDLFQIPINYYAFIRKDNNWNENEVREYKYEPNKELVNKIRQIM